MQSPKMDGAYPSSHRSHTHRFWGLTVTQWAMLPEHCRQQAGGHCDRGRRRRPAMPSCLAAHEQLQPGWMALHDQHLLDSTNAPLARGSALGEEIAGGNQCRDHAVVAPCKGFAISRDCRGECPACSPRAAQPYWRIGEAAGRQPPPIGFAPGACNLTC